MEIVKLLHLEVKLKDLIFTSVDHQLYNHFRIKESTSIEPLNNNAFIVCTRQKSEFAATFKPIQDLAQMYTLFLTHTLTQIAVCWYSPACA